MANEELLAKLAHSTDETEFYTPMPPGYRKGKHRYVVVVGTVMSGLGKGIFSSSLAKLLQDKGLKVAPIKMEGYYNIDSGTLNPYRHGEVFVLDDGMETDMDLGTYERLLDQDLGAANFTTNGQIFNSVLKKERSGGYLGRDVQAIPHVTGEIKLKLRELAVKSNADAVALTRHAAELGFAGALLLPPFYYKGVPDDGLFAYVEIIVRATAAEPIPIYLYHFPAQSGLPWHVKLVGRLVASFGTRIVGLKDSSGDMAYAREATKVAPGFKVFPSTEAVLMEARAGAFAGCISATANLNADLCARAWRDGDADALAAAVSIRKLFDGKQLVPGVKALIAHIHDDAGWARVQPPLSAFSPSDEAAVSSAYDSLRAGTARERKTGAKARVG